MNSIAIVGTGLIGASFGLAVKAAGFRGRILGVSSQGATRDALACGAIDEACSLADACKAADLIYLSQEIGRILETLAVIGSYVRRETLITDAGSTKTEIVAAASKNVCQAQFLGGHPLAGKEKRGALAAEPNLFAGRTYVLTPPGPEALETKQARAFLDLLRAIGAVPVVMTAEEHDRVVAWTSHLPQLLSTALAAALDERLTDEQLRVSGPGLQDMTRLAGSAWEIWQDILRTNTGPIANALDEFISRLQKLRAGMPEAGEEFERGHRLRSRPGTDWPAFNA